MNNAVKKNQKKNVAKELNGVDLNPRNVDLDNSHTAKLIDHFVYHTPSKGQIPAYAAINEAARLLAETIFRNTPTGSDQEAAIRKVVEAKMTANSAIATHPDLYP